MAYEHDILKDTLFVISHNLCDSVPDNVSRVSFKIKIMWSLLVWSCDLTFGGIWCWSSQSFSFISFFFFFHVTHLNFSLSHGSNPCAWLVNPRGGKIIIIIIRAFCISVGVTFPSGLFKQPNMDLQHTTGGYWQAVPTCGRGYGDWRFRLILSLQKLPSHIPSEQPVS